MVHFPGRSLSYERHFAPTEEPDAVAAALSDMGWQPAKEVKAVGRVAVSILRRPRL